MPRQMDDTWLWEMPDPHRLDQRVDLTGGDAVYPCFLNNRIQGFLRKPAVFEEGREVRAFTQHRDTQVERAEPGGSR